MDPEELVNPELDPEDRVLLVHGLNEWRGPARCTEELAIAMGFNGLDDFYATGYRLQEAIEQRVPLRRLDWRRALLARKIVFASDIVGSGHDWMFTTGLSDADTIERLRGLQMTLGPEFAGLIGHGLGSRPEPRPTD